MSSKPVVSIIVPVYNIEQYLDECIRSLVQQTYQNIEIILVDDGSTDASSDICDSYAKKYKDVKVRHQKNKGVSSARNAGIKAAKGEWIIFADGDDEMSSDAVDTLVNTAIKTEADCVSGNFVSYSDSHAVSVVSTSPEKIVLVDREEALKNLLYQRQIANAPFAKLYKADCIRKVRFSESITAAEDLQFNYFALKNVQKVAIIDTIVYLYRRREGSAINASFTRKRMSGLEATESIMQDVKQNNRLMLAAKNRFFMEAVFIGIQILFSSVYKKEYKRCKAIIKRYCIDVARDRESPLAYRLIAVVAIINVDIALMVVRLRSLRGRNES